ncbi:MAG: MBL fold metallo-hydrolase [Bacteroidota bacterium]|nr:MBL fold metallo-hydrolase [Bacteroidota bacterium]
MLYLKSFCFNPFQQNTYLIYDNKGTAYIIDPGNFTSSENELLKNFISEKKLTLKRLLLTHAHIDHILGNKFIFDTYGILPEVNKDDLYFIENMTKSGAMYGINCEVSPTPIAYINDGDIITLGEYAFNCIHTPGHSPGSISFYNKQNKLLISGDVLFYGSIGRTDLPKGNHQQLIDSIKQKLFILDDDTKVYSGHGQPTTIGFEKNNNPFLI